MYLHSAKYVTKDCHGILFNLGILDTQITLGLIKKIKK